MREVREQHAEAVLAPRDLVGDEQERATAPLIGQSPEAGQAHRDVHGDQRQDHRAGPHGGEIRAQLLATGLVVNPPRR